MFLQYSQFSICSNTFHGGTTQSKYQIFKLYNKTGQNSVGNVGKKGGIPTQRQHMWYPFAWDASLDFPIRTDLNWMCFIHFIQMDHIATRHKIEGTCELDNTDNYIKYINDITNVTHFTHMFQTYTNYTNLYNMFFHSMDVTA